MDFQEVGCGAWAGLIWLETEGQVAGICGCGTETLGSTNVGNFLTRWETVSFSRRTLLHGVSKQASK
jgi:hypothetical protein